MPKIPSVHTRRCRRVAVRYSIRRLDGEYWAAAYDQGNERYPEADYIGPDRESVCKVARERVNKAYVAKETTNNELPDGTLQ